MSLTIAFADQPPIILTTKFALKSFSSVLKRLCGLEEGFSEPNRDSDGHLTFPIQFGIPRNIFLKCIAFLRTGIIDSEDHIVAMSDVFNILGGCDEWDAFLQNRESQRLAKIRAEVEEREQRKQNPLTPDDNDLGLFIFEVHAEVWQHTDEWQVTGIHPTLNHVYWWRKRITE